MGDRAKVQITTYHGRGQREVSPTIYLHWDGNRVMEIAAELWDKCRGEDVDYLAARFVGIACRVSGGDRRGVGIFSADKLLTHADSPGDNGVFVIDVTEEPWKVTVMDGYDGDAELVVGAKPKEA